MLLVVIALLLRAASISTQFLPAHAVQPPPQRAAAARRTAALRLRAAATSTCRRCASRIASRCPTSIAARASPRSAPTLTNPLPSARGNSTERTESIAGRKDARARAPRRSPRRRRRPSKRRRSSISVSADMAMMQKPQMHAAARRIARRSAEEPAEVRAEGILQQPEGTGPGIRTAAVRHQGRRVRSVDSPLRLAGAPQLVRADGGDVACAGRVVITFYVHRNGALTDVTGGPAVGDRLVQHRRRQRAARVESDDAAAAGVSGRQGVLHGHVLLQRISAGQ